MDKIVNVMVHEELKLFHVSIHNKFKGGQTVKNPNIGWKPNASKAKTAYDNVITNSSKRQHTDRVLTAGLIIAFVNTNYVGWNDNIWPNSYPTNTLAQAKKEALITYWEQQGYTNVGVRNTISPNSGTGNGTVRWTAKFPKSMKKSKIDEKIELIGRSMNQAIPFDVGQRAYGAMAGTTYGLSGKAGFDPTNMAELLRFVRLEMGLI